MRVGFLGAGLIATFHSKMLRAAGVERAGVERAGVYDPDLTRAEAFAARSGHRVCRSEDEVLDTCDAVYVCTWTSEHPRLVAAAAARGLAVFCEKPLATGLDGAQAVVDAVEGAGVVCQVGLILRRSPAFVWARHLLRAPEAGAVVAVSFRDDQYLPTQGMYASTWRGDVARAGAGTLLEHSIHDLDLLRFLVGPVVDVTARTAARHGLPGIEDVAVLTLRFAGGALGTLVSVWHDNLARPSLRHLEVFCERRHVVVEGDDWFGPVRWTDTDGTTGALEGAALAEAAAALVPGPANPDEAFVQAARHGLPAWPGARAALEAHRVADAAYRSAAAGGAPTAPAGGPGTATLVGLAAADTHDLRRRVLRDGTPSDVVVFPEDADPGTFHVGARDGTGAVVATATLCPRPCPHRPTRRALQLRGMAVDPRWQGTGLGHRVLDEAVRRARGLGYEVLWAWARDSAVPFYQRAGLQVVGEGWVAEETRLPHHDVVLDL